MTTGDLPEKIIFRLGGNYGSENFPYREDNGFNDNNSDKFDSGFYYDNNETDNDGLMESENVLGSHNFDSCLYSLVTIEVHLLFSVFFQLGQS